jgi:hypothetical protein
MALPCTYPSQFTQDLKGNKSQDPDERIKKPFPFHFIPNSCKKSN